MEFGRRHFFRMAGAVGALVTVPQVVFQTTARAATRLSGVDYAAKFTAALGRPPKVVLKTSSKSVTMDVTQFTQQVLTGYPATKLYGYGVAGTSGSWPGPTLHANAKQKVNILWRNKLPKGTKKLATGGHLLPVDATLLDAAMTALPAGAKPIVPHVHGSHAEWSSDGHPEAWFTQTNIRGSKWRKTTSTYDNSQIGGTLWYHDHTHGITRLNVYAGMAGAYLLHDPTEAKLIANHVLPSAAYEREIVLQDRWFNDDGQLSLDTQTPPTAGTLISIYPDFILANGVPWPVMTVQPRKYRLRLINGSDSRFYVLRLSSDRSILVIGTELGLLPKAVSVSTLVMAPGERYDVILDFTGHARGTEVILQNTGVDGALQGFSTLDGTITNRPINTFAFGIGPTSNPASTGMVMKFTVSKKLSATKKGTVVAGTKLGPALPKLTATKTRKLMSFLGTDGQGRDMEMLGNVGAGGTKMWMDPVTEVITKGTTEIWEFYNTSVVAHPLHIHLVNFLVLDRAPFDYTSVPKTMMDGGTGGVVSIVNTGTRRLPEPYERGRKDTVICYPGEVTRIIATFDRAGSYVWHCHILHHEDHDMMRPITVR
ncbi:MAG TPA: multicopper oxidase domain-containing protein [Kineosporiaceae bacterium]|nr:multicopper oxidase domain-containing protein [Kineosporiaceae bacterium]